MFNVSKIVQQNFSAIFLVNRDSDKSSSTSVEKEPLRPILKWNTSVNPGGNRMNNNNNDSRKFASLFNSLKGQYLANTEKQHKLR